MQPQSWKKNSPVCTAAADEVLLQAARAQPITHWRSFAKFENIAELHPYQWLRTPHAKSVRSFSAWRGK
jgi:hypothetical protein